MKYLSTRGGASKTPSEAVLMGISPEGGLFVPEDFPSISTQLERWRKLSYKQLAAEVLSLYFSDFTLPELAEFTDKAYARFPSEVVPIRNIYGNVNMIELWHGPTLAFKDMALQVLPYLLTSAMEKTGEKSEILILVATSGDTGKAALEGFRDVDRTKIAVFYPDGGVSNLQRLQMVTQEGNNVFVSAIKGNFDDAQTGVKKIFADKELKKLLAGKNIKLSSANSINWGRLSPQIAYYFWAYFEMIRSGQIKMGDAINVAVPTGNFGNILAAYYAKRMGLNIKKLICASNKNKILSDFFSTGNYKSLRAFYKTMSPSMDILVSSNLERLLFEVVGRDSGKVSEMMASLSSGGEYSIDDGVRQRLSQEFYGGWLDEQETLAEIKHVYDHHGYIMDTHTAVGHGVYRKYLQQTGDTTPVAIASTASPYKFSPDVLSALQKTDSTEEQSIQQLFELTGLPVPAQAKELSAKAVLHEGVCEKTEMSSSLLAWMK